MPQYDDSLFWLLLAARGADRLQQRLRADPSDPWHMPDDNQHDHLYQQPDDALRRCQGPERIAGRGRASAAIALCAQPDTGAGDDDTGRSWLAYAAQLQFLVRAGDLAAHH